MGALSELGDDFTPDGLPIRGEGRRLVEWWDEVADDEDRAMLRSWLENDSRRGGKSRLAVAELLTASGFPISRHTVDRGVRLLRRFRWDS